MRNFYRGPSSYLNQWEQAALARKLAPISEPVRRDDRRVSQRGYGPSGDWLTAVHESGHEIGSLAQGIPVVEVGMDNRGGGYCLNARLTGKRRIERSHRHGRWRLILGGH